MKIRNALLIPLTIVADLCTLGNMGERSFTQQLFDSDIEEKKENKKRKNLIR